MSSSDDPLNDASAATRRPSQDAHVKVLASQESGSESQAWVQWEYNHDEWVRFEKIDWGRTRRTFWLLVCLCFPFVADMLIIILTAIFLAPAPGFTNVLILPLCGVFVIPSIVPVIVISSYSYIYTQAKKRHRTRQQDRPHRVTIAQQGLWEAGTYIPFGILNEVKMTFQPPVIHFRRDTSLEGGKNTPRQLTLRVFVPGGHEEQAAQLVQRFRTEVIEARKQAWQRLINPPEPV